MKKLIISMLVILATTSIQQSLRGNNSEINSNNYTFILNINSNNIYNQLIVKNYSNEFLELFNTAERKIKVSVQNGGPKIANATIKIVSLDGVDNIGPYLIEEGSIYEYDLPDTTWYVEVISISEDSEVISWYE
jgi:hypothetical protein